MNANTAFREKVLDSYKRIARKYPFLMYPAMFAAAFVLTLYGIKNHIINNFKRYFAVAFAVLFFTFSCSFTGAVFNTESVYFVEDEPEVLVAIDSDAELAQETQIDPTLLDDADVMDGDVENIRIEDVDMFTMEDLEIDQESLDEEVKLSSGYDYKFDSDDWKLILINKQHPIPDSFELHLGQIKGSMQCDERIIAELFSMMQAAKKDGVELVICSPYRDLQRQEMLFNKKIRKYMSQGMSYMDAYKITSQAVTVPGASEHQIGLALDIVSTSYSTLDEGFGETDEGKWLAQHSCEYGFILRYPAGKEYITSIEFEPWHFRYVGKEAASYITEQNITLEEFWDQKFNL